MLANARKSFSGATVVVLNYKQRLAFQNDIGGVACADWQGSSLGATARLWMFRKSTAAAFNLSNVDNVTATVASCSRRRLSLVTRRELRAAVKMATSVTSGEDKSSSLANAPSLVSSGFKTAAASLPAQYANVKSIVSSETLPTPSLGTVSYETSFKTQVVTQPSAANAISSKLVDTQSSGGLKAMLATAGVPATSITKLSAVAATSLPTASPSLAPTRAPTAPTAQPTTSPTDAPSTAKPTASPTRTPTLGPCPTNTSGALIFHWGCRDQQVCS